MANTDAGTKYLRDIPNGKWKIVQNRKATDSDTEEDDDDEDDEELPEENGTPEVYDFSERDGKQAPMRTNPEKEKKQIHTDAEISGENSKTNIKRSHRTILFLPSTMLNLFSYFVNTFYYLKHSN